jgi:rfaE bifunctional protein nucleotidyltransferase chain/domain
MDIKPSFASEQRNEKIISRAQAPNRTVLVGGCFDLIHYGHIVFLTKAKSYGSRLVVALESDENVRKLKGANRPIHSQIQRKHMLEALSCVDKVIELPPLHADTEYFAFVKKIMPQVIAVTEGDPIEDKKRKQAVAVGARLVVIPKVHTPSTSQLAKLLELD